MRLKANVPASLVLDVRFFIRSIESNSASRQNTKNYFLKIVRFTFANASTFLAWKWHIPRLNRSFLGPFLL